MALANSSYTLFAAVSGTNVKMQDPPMLEETVAVPGGQWTWSASIASGNFASGTTFDFEYDSSSASRQKARLIAHIPSGGWTDNGNLIDGVLTITLNDNWGHSKTYSINLSLRTICFTAFTLFKGQTTGEPLLPSNDTGPYAFSVPFNAAGEPSDTPDWRNGISDSLRINCSSNGAMSIAAEGVAAWTEDGTFTIGVTRGNQPTSYIRGLHLSLRKLKHTAFTLFKGQTTGDSILVDGDTGPYTFSTPADTTPLSPGGPDWRNGIPDELAIQINNKGAMSDRTTDPLSAVNWDEDGTFTIGVTRGNGPTSYIQNLDLSLRKLEHSAFTLFKKQSAGDSILPSGDTGPYTFGAPYNFGPLPPGAPRWRNGIDNGLRIRFTSRGGMSIDGTPPAGIAWDEDGTFTISIQRGVHPTCYIQNLDLSLRKLDCEAFTLFKNQTDSDPIIPSGQTYTITAPTRAVPMGSPNWRDGISNELAIKITNQGHMSVDMAHTTDTDWDENGTFTLSIRRGAQPASYIHQLPLSLRRLAFDEFVLFKNQINGAPLLPDGDTGPYVFDAPVRPTAPGAAPDRIGISDTLGIGFGARGEMSVLNPGDASFNENGTFTLAIKRGNGPTSYLGGCLIHLRRLFPNKLRLAYPSGKGTLSVFGNRRENWQWGPITEDLAVTEITCTSGDHPDEQRISTSSLEPGEHGTLTAELTLCNDGKETVAPTAVVYHPISTDLGLKVCGMAGKALPVGRSKMRYQAELEAIVNNEPGCELKWVVDLSPPLSSALSIETDTTTDRYNFLSTPISGSGNAVYLPELPAPQLFSVPVTVIKHTTGIPSEELARSETIAFDFTMMPTKDTVNVAVLLDRSYFMWWFHRWHAAASAAGSFANLMAGTSDDHNVGFYWFASGHNAAGPFKGRAGSYALSTGIARSDASNVGNVIARRYPIGRSGLGKGLLYCRNELLAADTGSEERIILLLSGSEENSAPFTTEVFENSTSPDYWDSPDVRIYPLGLMTPPDWQQALRRIVHSTGGIPAVDVTHISKWTNETPQKITHWFITMFSSLFGYTQTLAPPDPKLAKNRTETYPVKVHTGQSRLVFYMTHHEPNPKDWAFSLVLPEGAGVITQESAKNTEGISFAENQMGKMMTIDFPLTRKDCEHVWAGTWKMVVKRVGKGSGYYAVGSLAKQDLTFDVEVLSSSKPIPGDTVTIQAALKDAKGRPIKGARVVAEVTEPDGWTGDHLVKKAQRHPDLLSQMSKFTPKGKADSAPDNLVQQLMQTVKNPIGRVKTIILKQTPKGIYIAQYKVTMPGEYNIDAKATGLRSKDQGELKNKKNIVLQAALENITPIIKTLSQKEIRQYKQRATSRIVDTIHSSQPFQLTCRTPLKVEFVPDVKESICFGYMEDEKTIVMHVEPRDNTGRRLGPGWARAIAFITPAGIDKKWPAKDMLDGTYEAEIPINVVQPAYAMKENAVIGKTVTLTHPNEKKRIRPKNRILPLGRFSVEILDVRLHVPVFALVGNKKTKQVHLFTCQHAQNIDEGQIEWFTDLQEIKKHGFDTCELCMPLICNIATKEAHKPLCKQVRRIHPKNRSEYRSLRRALSAGFEGCKHCLAKYHKR